MVLRVKFFFSFKLNYKIGVELYTNTNANRGYVQS